MQTALLLGLVYVFGWINYNALCSYMHRPIIICALTGLVLGDFKTGLVIGGTMELAWMGLLPYAGMVTAEETMGAIFGTYFAITTGNSFEVAIGIGLPTALLGAYLSTLLFTVGSYFMHRCDKYAEEGDIDRINRWHISFSIIGLVLCTSIVVIGVYFGNDLISSIVNAIPENIMDGLGKASDLLPAVGFAMLLNILWDKRFVPLFFIGFAVSVYLELNVMAVTILSLSAAMLIMYLKEDRLEVEDDD